MALITSAATGNFNATGTWSGGVVPVAGDEARVSNGHVVTITANATATLLSNSGTGYFVLNSGVTLTANVTNATSTGNNPCVRFTSASPASATIVGNITASGTSAANAHAVQNSSTGTLNITGNVTGGSSQTSNGVVNSTTGTVNITGNCTGGTSGNCWSVNNTSGQIVVTGNVTGGSATAASGFPSGISNDTGTVTVTGIVSAGAIASSHGISNLTTGNITVVGEVIATNGANGINSTNTSSVVRASGSMTYSANGTLPIMANRFFLNTTPSQARTRYALNGSSTYFDMSGADVAAAGGVATSNVRAGVTYAGLTGTCAVPPAASVALGVPVDNTTGTAILTGAAIATAVWGAATRTLTAGGGISASDVWDYATRSLTTSSGATAVEIRQEMDSNSTKLANLDATVSSRLATSGYTAPSAAPTAAQNATAVWGAATKEITGGTVTTLTNAPSVPSAASIRAEIDSSSTQLAAIKAKTDLLPASPAATGDIPSANISAIKAKTDLLETTRLAQCSTVATTGAQLAAALS